MVANGNRRVFLAATASLLITCCSFTPSTFPVVMAQVAPTPVQNFAWTRAGSDLIILGGMVDLNNVAQLTSSQNFALDLSVSWPVAAAPWRALTNGTIAQTFYAVSSPNNQTVLTFQVGAPTGSLSITAYDIVAKTWSSPVFLTTNADILQYGQIPATDPTSGLVYIAGTNNMNAYNIASKVWTVPGAIAPTILTSRPYSTPVYNPTRKTIMYVGGNDYAVSVVHFDPTVVVTEYAPATNKWSVMNTTGTAPAPVANHCTAINEDGSTMIVFGGRMSAVTPAFTGNIYILDVLTGVWTKGPAQATPRVYPACVLLGDQFVVWGGSYDGINTLPSVEPIVFDLTLNQWTTSYKAPAYYLSNPLPKPSGSAGSNGNSSSSNNGSSGESPKSSVSLGPIVGGVVGVLAVVCAIGGFLVYRRRQNKQFQEIKEQVSQQKMALEAERADRLDTQNNRNRRNDDDDGSTGDIVGGGYGAAAAAALISSGGDNSAAPASYAIGPNSYAMAPISNGGDNSAAPASYAIGPNSYAMAPISNGGDNSAAPASYAMAPNSYAKAPINNGVDSSMAHTPYPMAPTSYVVPPASYPSPPTTYPSPLAYSPNSNSNRDAITAYKYEEPSSPPHLKDATTAYTYKEPYTTGSNNYSPQNPQSYQKPMGVNGPQEYLTPTGRAPQVVGNEPGIYHEQEPDRVRQNHPQGGISEYR